MNTRKLICRFNSPDGKTLTGGVVNVELLDLRTGRPFVRPMSTNETETVVSTNLQGVTTNGWVVFDLVPNHTIQHITSYYKLTVQGQEYLFIMPPATDVLNDDNTVKIKGVADTTINGVETPDNSDGETLMGVDLDALGPLNASDTNISVTVNQKGDAGAAGTHGTRRVYIWLIRSKTEDPYASESALNIPTGITYDNATNELSGLPTVNGVQWQSGTNGVRPPINRLEQEAWESHALYDPNTSTLTAFTQPLLISYPPAEDGTDGQDGSYEVKLYIQQETRPTTPTNITYNGTTFGGSGLGSWVDTQPTGTPVWITRARFNPNNNTLTAWSTPRYTYRQGKDGAPGRDGTDGTGAVNPNTLNAVADTSYRFLMNAFQSQKDTIPSPEWDYATQVGNSVKQVLTSITSTRFSDDNETSLLASIEYTQYTGGETDAGKLTITFASGTTLQDLWSGGDFTHINISGGGIGSGGFDIPITRDTSVSNAVSFVGTPFPDAASEGSDSEASTLWRATADVPAGRYTINFKNSANELLFINESTDTEKKLTRDGLIDLITANTPQGPDTTILQGAYASATTYKAGDLVSSPVVEELVRGYSVVASSRFSNTANTVFMRGSQLRQNVGTTVTSIFWFPRAQKDIRSDIAVGDIVKATFRGAVSDGQTVAVRVTAITSLTSGGNTYDQITGVIVEDTFRFTFVPVNSTVDIDITKSNLFDFYMSRQNNNIGKALAEEDWWLHLGRGDVSTGEITKAYIEQLIDAKTEILEGNVVNG